MWKVAETKILSKKFINHDNLHQEIKIIWEYIDDDILRNLMDQKSNHCTEY